MNSVMKHTKKEDAVSPVVGVMLMLVVTIVIAAIVAAFAGGIGTDVSAPTTAIIKLDSYTMSTVNQDKNGNDLVSSFRDGWYDYGVSLYGGPASNYAPYKMVFKNTGGSSLLVNDLKLAITYNGATYITPLNTVTSVKEWNVGDKLTLAVTTDMLKAGTMKYGLSQQSMTNKAAYTFDWKIQDAGNNIIAKGTESNKWTQNVISVTVDESYTTAVAGTIKVSAPSYDNGTTVTIAVADGAGFTLSPTTGTITSGAATIEVTPTLEGSEQKTATITVTVGSVSETASITVNPTP